ncbi:hypothetical protein TTHERM_00543640 (macronuclear) [Tetrahymena thermophila SB210]|uniref:Kinase domain protein n=1 Tax=Tetrahymena thermophila (strain SB210) TaxID=312017 RepID=I7MD95_TETTS|nr:hypothetical protein TTHERM_00543640 [Tetrahymena thermophila SB210]EAR86024.1 hypothetical protein TTHERM_00543640 [Tetrahymena thermophila SB210]|eukprot:XP_976619.1 hypothetical protein TTHERM_00543640 [Tetrahymena thermophila SB210]
MEQINQEIEIESVQNQLGSFLQRYLTITTLKEQLQIPYQSSYSTQFPSSSHQIDSDLDENSLQDLEIFNFQSIKTQNYFINYINHIDSSKVLIELSHQPYSYTLFQTVFQLINNNKFIQKVHLKFHYQMETQEISLLNDIMRKPGLIEFKLTLENNKIVTKIFTVISEILKESETLKSFSLEILNYPIKSNDTEILSQGISANKSLKEIEIVSYFLIHEYNLIIDAISNLEQLEIVKLDLTYSTDYISDSIEQIGLQIASKLKNLKEIYVQFKHFRIIDNNAIVKLLECIYSNQSITTISILFPFTSLDIEDFNPFNQVAKRKQPINLHLDIRIASNSAMDYLLQIFRLNTFKILDIKNFKNIHARLSRLLNSQIMYDEQIEQLNLQCSYNDLIQIDEGLSFNNQLHSVSLIIKFDIIDFVKLKEIGNFLQKIPKLSYLNLVFSDCKYDVKHLTNLIVNKLQSKSNMVYMRLTLFKYSSKQDQLIQFFEDNLNSRVILDVNPHNYTIQDPYLHIINITAREQLVIISKIFYFNKNIAPLLHYNPQFIFSDLYLD